MRQAAVRVRLSGERGHDLGARRAGDVVFSDELNHASIIDGCRLSRAEKFVYQHSDIEHLKSWSPRNRVGIAAPRGRRPRRTDRHRRVFSMDGDFAPLTGDRRARRDTGPRARRRRARDRNDRPGWPWRVAEAGVEDEVDVIIGTLSKALGSYGA